MRVRYLSRGGTPDHARLLHRGERRLSYLDFGGAGRRCWLCMATTTRHGIRAAGGGVAPRWRVFALDQRGHGCPTGPKARARRLVCDVAAFHRHLAWPRGGAWPLVGGVNAYQYAGRHPDRVTAPIVEDIGAVVDTDWSFTIGLPRLALSRAALASALGSPAPYLECSFRRSEDGWGFSFDIDDTVASQKALNGDHWLDWIRSPAPRC